MTILLPQAIHIRAYFQDTGNDQTITTAGTPQVVLFNQVPDNANIVLKDASNQTWNGTTVTTGQRFVFNSPGDYHISFVAQAMVSLNQPIQMRMWWKLNGTTDIPGSSTAYLITNNTGAGVAAANIITRSMIYDFLTVGDYIELWMDADTSNRAGLRSLAPATGPTAPGVVVNIHQIGYEYV